jgi:hypothetical protein
VSGDAHRPDPSLVLAGLKDFQRDTVDYVFRRLYTDEDATRRFLVADEVGLGKTLVARGLIARAIDQLWNEVGRIDIVYVCSNADIARQNVNRLNVTGREDFTLTSRITLLPTEVRALQQNRLNFISFTPATSFDLRSALGTADERALLYWLLDEAWGMSGMAPLNVLQGYMDRDNFRERVRYFDRSSIDPSLSEAFERELARRVAVERVEGRTDLRSRFDELCERFARSRKHLPEDDRHQRRSFVGDMRSLLAEVCLAALEPDLIILDEFQRFKYLLDADNDVSRLAHGLFDYADEHSKARVVLLSATPYKMYTRSGEASGDDHYEDFQRTLRFLYPEGIEESRSLLRDYRRELFRLADGGSERLLEAKRRLEARLRRVMVRTERLAATDDRDGMLAEVPDENVILMPQDLLAYVSLQRVASTLGEGAALEYWKSAPYLLNFMENYKIKEAFRGAVSAQEHLSELARALSEEGLLPWREISAYGEVDPANARLRSLLADVVEMGAWRLLWLPPSLPYYELGRPFADPALKLFTKRLIFSSWAVVPKVVAAMVSYEAERRMVRSIEPDPENTPEARKSLGSLLRFSRAEGRLTGMPVLALVYPSAVLARECDPLLLGAEDARDGLPTLEAALSWAERRLEPSLREVLAEHASEGRGSEDAAWYWAAPILMDLKFDARASRAWLSDPWLAEKWSGGAHVGEESEEDETNWAAHVEEARRLVASGRQRLGRPPADLSRVLAEMALAGPAVAALRALSRVSGDPPEELAVREHAARVAWCFRSLLNLPEVTALVRGTRRGERREARSGAGREEPYWRAVLGYCGAGGLQPTLDEYAHNLRDSLGLLDERPAEVAREVADAMCEALTLRTSVLGVDEVAVDAASETVELNRRRMRGHFALRFGQERSEDGAQITRASQVRQAFNSPFWPFVLATTSIGQEGLDFHTYCHAVIHWNLPSNPVDLEQREGRVHRYKGHAVRKNLARRYGLSEVDGAHAVDPWEQIFTAGRRDRPARSSDLVPFWVYATEGGAKIERHVPALPLSRELERIEVLRRSLAAYRMVFGQARQEDLLAYLLSQLPEEEVERLSQSLRISLEPPREGRG